MLTVEVGPQAAEIDQTDLLDRIRRRNYLLGDAALIGANVMPADSLPVSAEAHARYETFVNDLESVGTPLTVAERPINERMSLYDALHSAGTDAESLAMVQMNATTEVMEIMCKSGNVLHVQAAMTPDGEIEQFGQTTRNRQRMTLQYYPDQSAALRANTDAEGRNAFTIEDLWRAGELNGKIVMEATLVPDNCSRQELSDYGYFLDSMTAIIRLTKISSTGSVDIISGLVGGVDTDQLPAYKSDDTAEDEARLHDQALAMRFDITVIRDMYAAMGFENAMEMTTTELLGAMAVLPDRYDIADFMMLYDQIAAVHLGKEVFFGLSSLRREYPTDRALTREDYEKQMEIIRERQALLAPTVEAVTGEMIRRRREATDPLATVRLLKEIATRHTLRHAVLIDQTVDARMIFGRQAAVLVADARIAAEWQAHEAVEQKLQQAEMVADTKTCPTGGGRKSSDRQAAEATNKSDDVDKTSDKPGDASAREWMRCVNCPLCKKPGVDAAIDYFPRKRTKRITCSSCKGHKDYPM
jgi:hypothetical protein